MRGSRDEKPPCSCPVSRRRACSRSWPSLLYLNVRERTLLEQAALQDVVVATRDILSNTVIDERNVAAARVPAEVRAAGRAYVDGRRGRARGRRADPERIAR